MSGADLFSPGDVLRHRYRIVRLVGKGGTGEVYEAEDRVESRRVAIKTVLRELVTSAKVGRRFERECELSQRISHPNVLRIYALLRGPVEVSVDGESWSLVWEHSGGAVSESSWSEQIYDLSVTADGASTVYIRWSMGPTDGSVT